MLEKLNGRHEGMRRVHAKGTLCSATFTPDPAAASISRAAHLTGGPHRAHVRFSNGGGNPEGRDTAPDGRGLAMKVYLPDGSTTDLIGLTLSQFFVRTPEDFLAFLQAREPGPDGKPDMAKLGAFFGEHPEGVAAAQEAVTAKPPVSYAQLTYNAIHAFRFVDADGNGRFVRYRWVPAAGEAFLESAEGEGPNYLQDDLRTRFESGPVVFDVVAILAQDGDDPDDPTVAWPDDREIVPLGRLDITAVATDRERDGDVLVFDPSRVTDGVELGGDKLVQARSDAYAESVLRRSGVKRGAPA
jgi:catalase